MPKWEMVRLGELGLFQSGGTPASNKTEYFRGVYPWITTPALGPTYIAANCAKAYLTDEAIKNSATKIIPANSLMIGIRVGVGRASINIVPMCTNQDIVSISAINESMVSREYLHKYIQTQQNYLTSQKRGATIQGITTEILKTLLIPLPPLRVQKQIADVLDRSSTLIEKRQAQIAKLDLLVKSRFVEMFGDPVVNPMGWEMKPLSDVITHANNGMSRRGNDANGGIVLRLVELQDGYIDYSKPNRIILNDAEKTRYTLLDGDFLFARVNGNPENVGRCATFKNYCETVYHNDHIIRVRFDNTVINGIFASQLLNSSYGKIEMKDKIKTSAGQYTINQAGIGEIKAPLPPLSLQSQFAAFVEQADKSKFKLKQSLAKMELNCQSLMQKCFRGEIF